MPPFFSFQPRKGTEFTEFFRDFPCHSVVQPSAVCVKQAARVHHTAARRAFAAVTGCRVLVRPAAFAALRRRCRILVAFAGLRLVHHVLLRVAHQFVHLRRQRGGASLRQTS